MHLKSYKKTSDKRLNLFYMRAVVSEMMNYNLPVGKHLYVQFSWSATHSVDDAWQG